MTTHSFSCHCGKLRFRSRARPILCAACHCADCQAGARQIQALENTSRVLDEFAGSAYMTFRDDHLIELPDVESLIALNLRSNSPTTRYVSKCCHSPMFLKFKPGWWISVYRARCEGAAPALEMRTCLKSLPPQTRRPSDVPGFSGHPLSLFWRLLGARIAMWFRR